MTTVEHLQALQIAVAILMIGCALLWAIPHPCRCDSCPKHTRDRALARESKRAAGHRHLHRYYNLKWPDPKCASCRDGHLDDEHKRE